MVTVTRASVAGCAAGCSCEEEEGVTGRGRRAGRGQEEGRREAHLWEICN